MKTVIMMLLLTAVLSFMFQTAATAPEGQRMKREKTILDLVNVDETMSNEELINEYFYCLMEKKPCTKLEQTIKDYVDAAILTRCAQCTPAEKNEFKKVAEFMKREKKPMYDQLLSKYMVSSLPQF